MLTTQIPLLANAHAGSQAEIPNTVCTGIEFITTHFAVIDDDKFSIGVVLSVEVTDRLRDEVLPIMSRHDAADQRKCFAGLLLCIQIHSLNQERRLVLSQRGQGPLSPIAALLPSLDTKRKCMRVPGSCCEQQFRMVVESLSEVCASSTKGRHDL